MPHAANQRCQQHAPWFLIVAGCGFLWNPSSRAEDAPRPPPSMRAEAIAAFSYAPKSPSDLDPIWKVGQPNAGPTAIDPTVVAMAPMVVHAPRGLAPQQFRTMDASIQQQERIAAEPKLPFIKIHEFRLSRKLYFGYVSIFGIPVAGGFSW